MVCTEQFTELHNCAKCYIEKLLALMMITNSTNSILFHGTRSELLVQHHCICTMYWYCYQFDPIKKHWFVTKILVVRGHFNLIEKCRCKDESSEAGYKRFGVAESFINYRFPVTILNDPDRIILAQYLILEHFATTIPVYTKQWRGNITSLVWIISVIHVRIIHLLFCKHVFISAVAAIPMACDKPRAAFICNYNGSSRYHYYLKTTRKRYSKLVVPSPRPYRTNSFSNFQWSRKHGKFGNASHATTFAANVRSAVLESCSFGLPLGRHDI